MNWTRHPIRIAALAIILVLAHQQRAEAQEAHRGFAAITVSDLAESEQWYSAHLGTERLSASRSPSGHAENVVVGNDYIVLELIRFAEQAAGDTVSIGTREIGLKKVGVWIDPAAFDRVHADLAGMNARFIGGIIRDERLGARTFLVKDNSGVIIQFFAQL